MKIFAIILVAALMVGCTTRTVHGHCTGLRDSHTKNPAKEYQVSWWNVFLGVIFSESIVVPVVVVSDYLVCPVADK